MSKRKLLLADDSITIQKVVNLTFADEGVEVIAVSDGDAAMIKFNESMPDLVLADVNMPGLDGYRICEMIKQDDETKHIPVILLVGSFEPFDEQEAFRVGADDFLTKPFQSIRQLVTKVSDLLNPPSALNNPAQPTNVLAESEPNNDWQFADTKELPIQELTDENLGDTGMDDEMIQTSQVEEPTAIDEVQKFISDSYSYKGDESESVSAQETLTEDSFQDESAEDFAILEPTAEIEQVSFDDEVLAENKAVSDNKVYDFADYEITEKDLVIVEESEIREEVEVVETLGAPTQNYVFAEKIAEAEKVSDWAVVTADYEETEEIKELETEIATEVLSEEVSSEFEVQEPEVSQVFGETETDDAQVSDETEAVEESFETKSETQELPVKNASAVTFDDLDLLELPPLVEETGIRPQSEIKEIKTFVEEIEPEVAETTDTAEIEANIETSEISATDETFAETFPPELIEAITKKVIERLSDKVIREIGWEVVPPMADLIVKKIVEEHFEKQAKEMS